MIPVHDSSIEELLRWCSARGIEIDARINVIRREDASVTVRARDADVVPKTTLVSIPKTTILSARNCSLSEHIPRGLYGIDAQLGLTLGLYGEILRGTTSPWFGYLQSLPKHVSIPLVWDVTNVDEERALSWLRGTMAEVEMILSDRKGNRDEKAACSGHTAELQNYYSSVAERALKEAGLIKEAAFAGFKHAFALVCSRAFKVDAYHGLSMVPIADAFNHDLDHQVHLESDYYVCPVCGSLFECPHDDEAVGDKLSQRNMPEFEMHRKEIQSSVKEHHADDTCDMVANALISPFSEIHNTYGEDLTNAQLLVRYGFLLDNNENDIISWNNSDLHIATESVFKLVRVVGNTSAGGGDLSSLDDSHRDNKNFVVFGDFDGRTVERSQTTITRKDQDSLDPRLRSELLCKTEMVEAEVPISSWVEVLLERVDLALTRWSGGLGDLKKSELIYVPNDHTDQGIEGQKNSHEGYMRQGFSSGSQSEYVRGHENACLSNAAKFPKIPHRTGQPSLPLWLNDDGQISQYLWLFCALLALHAYWITDNVAFMPKLEPSDYPSLSNDEGQIDKLPTSPEEDIAALKLILQVQVEMEELSLNADACTESHSGDEANKIRVRAKEGSEQEAMTIKLELDDPELLLSVPESSSGVHISGSRKRKHEVADEKSDSGESFDYNKTAAHRDRTRDDGDGITISVSALPQYASESESDFDDDDAQWKREEELVGGGLPPPRTWDSGLTTKASEDGLEARVGVVPQTEGGGRLSDRRLDPGGRRKFSVASGLLVVADIARIFNTLCEVRIQRMAYPQLDAAALGELIDAIPETHVLERSAAQLALGERARLASWASTWAMLAHACRQANS